MVVCCCCGGGGGGGRDAAQPAAEHCGRQCGRLRRRVGPPELGVLLHGALVFKRGRRCSSTPSAGVAAVLTACMPALRHPIRKALIFPMTNSPTPLPPLHPSLSFRMLLVAGVQGIKIRINCPPGAHHTLCCNPAPLACCSLPIRFPPSQVLLDAGAPNIKIICKIESQAGLINFDDILSVADGIMVARGDLAMVRVCVCGGARQRLAKSPRWWCLQCGACVRTQHHLLHTQATRGAAHTACAESCHVAVPAVLCSCRKSLLRRLPWRRR